MKKFWYIVFMVLSFLFLPHLLLIPAIMLMNKGEK